MTSAPEPTKLHYLDGRPTELTLRRIKLEVLKGDRVETHTFDERDAIQLGAADENDLVLRDETVSRHHCRIFQEAGQYMIRDLDSTNGTFVNRVRIREAWLKPGCTVTLGTTELRFASTDETFRIVPSERSRFQELIGRDAKMREIYAILEKIGPTDATVVIEGETGTGKEVVARSVHLASRRASGPFMVFDCGAVPENLIESELFGHEKGSFTGAIGTRQGIFELANGGTVFLDELGELALDLQPKLLRVLEQREVKRVGGTKPIKVDVRVVAATNRDLEDEVRGGRFREDLFYRLSVVRLMLPPLRKRKDDIPILIQHFLKLGRFNHLPDGSRKVKLISRTALDRLMDYDWPGNVRELHNVIERAVSFAEGDAIEVRDLPDHIAIVHRPIHEESTVKEKGPSSSGVLGSQPDVKGTFKDAKEAWVATFEKDYIEALLKRNDNNISHAAREAEIDRKYFRKLMKKYGITATDDED
ncbi:MAG: sigma 54-interacting transcriptional regulator [Myxococcales bacterium]|nr:sigma 54-interacting transcriptional regulator [Myxococcales bacterium]